jgi:hypothetical protein
MRSFWLESGGSQLKEMGKGVGTIFSREIDDSYLQMIDDSSDRYADVMVLNQDSTFGGTGTAAVTALNDITGGTQALESAYGVDITGSYIDSEERARRALIGGGQAILSATGGASVIQSARAGWKGTKVVNVGGPLDENVSPRSLRSDYMDLDLTPTNNPNTIIADLNSVDLSSLAGNKVRLLRASNVPFTEVPSGAYVNPNVFASQAIKMGVRQVVVSTGVDSVAPLSKALQSAGYKVTIRNIGGRTIVTGTLP